MSHDECQKELEQLKERLAVLIPIVREQKRAASRRADNDYFAEKDIPPR